MPITHSTVLIFSKFSSLDIKIEPGLCKKNIKHFNYRAYDLFPISTQLYSVVANLFPRMLEIELLHLEKPPSPTLTFFFLSFKSDLFLRFSGNNQDSA